MKAHYLDDSSPISIDTLRREGVLYETLPTDEASFRAPLDALSRERGYVKEDIVALSPDTPNLDAICQKFIGEHFHTEDEVRFVLEGEGIFDIRSGDDRYMRITVERGDLIVVPGRRHHRFMLTEKKHIRCVRLFEDEAGWVAHYRDAS
jgi:1,2-dihydroxy-3-keto-5-methylthiopentene dioxygenase